MTMDGSILRTHEYKRMWYPRGPHYVSAYSCPHRRESPAAGGGTQIDAQQ